MVRSREQSREGIATKGEIETAAQKRRGRGLTIKVHDTPPV